MVCRNLCERWERISTKNGLAYIQGARRCTRCKIVFMTTASHCPCCGTKLSAQPASHRAKLAFRQLKESQHMQDLANSLGI